MSIEAMKDALEALEWLTASNDLAQPEDIPKIVINLRTAIEAAENVQPYGWANLDEVTEQFNSVNCGTVYRLPGEDRSPLYTTPPAQEFVCSTGLCHYKATSEKRECMNCAAFGECNPNNDAGRCGYEPPAAQRQWVGLTDEEWQDLSDRYGMILFGKFKNEIEAKLRERNT